MKLENFKNPFYILATCCKTFIVILWEARKKAAGVWEHVWHLRDMFISVLGRFFECLKNRLFWFCKYWGIKTKPAGSDYFKKLENWWLSWKSWQRMAGSLAGSFIFENHDCILKLVLWELMTFMKELAKTGRFSGRFFDFFRFLRTMFVY